MKHINILRIALVLALTGLGFTIAPITARASALPFEKIIRKAEEQQSLTINLTGDIANSLPKKPEGSSWTLAKEPLFLQKLSLDKLPPETTSSKFSPEDLYKWIKEQPTFGSITPENARMVIENERVIDFSPGRVGIYTDFRRTTAKLMHSLADNSSQSPLVGISVLPTNTLASTNEYGINEFISGGYSDFTGSSKNRLANIEAGTRQMRGILIKPGATFSFGDSLGEITAAQGFKPEIVIKADGLKPELGGGICQVSSTLYRAVMQSGMAITQRKNHAFSVSHYLPAGTDATIYTPATDLKFVNDTPAYVLIWPYYSGKTGLVFDLYGTRDGRSVVVDEPVQWDKKSDGSLKASWSRHVTKDGTTRDDVFKSTYLPPALFRKVETFIPATPSLPAGTTENTNTTQAQ